MSRTEHLGISWGALRSLFRRFTFDRRLHVETLDSTFLATASSLLSNSSPPLKKVHINKDKCLIDLSDIVIGFNLENSFARFLVYSTFLVNGNPITNLMSIGAATSATGQNPPLPATVAGLNTHNNCEGDTSMTRGMYLSLTTWQF